MRGKKKDLQTIEVTYQSLYIKYKTRANGHEVSPGDTT